MAFTRAKASKKASPPCSSTGPISKAAASSSVSSNFERNSVTSDNCLSTASRLLASASACARKLAVSASDCSMRRVARAHASLKDATLCPNATTLSSTGARRSIKSWMTDKPLLSMSERKLRRAASASTACPVSRCTEATAESASSMPGESVRSSKSFRRRWSTTFILQLRDTATPERIKQGDLFMTQKMRHAQIDMIG